MMQPRIIGQGSWILIEQIAARTKSDIPVLIEITTSRHDASPGGNHVDAINYFEGFIERLDRTLPSGCSRSPTWSELDRGLSRRNAPRRLYLYVQTRIGLAELGHIETAAAELALSMNLLHGLAMAPGIAMTSSEIAADGVAAARNELLGLIPDDPHRHLAPERYSVRARWVEPGRANANGGAAGMATETDRRARGARLYLTLLRRCSTSRTVSVRTRLDPRRSARVLECRQPQCPVGRLVAGPVDPGWPAVPHSDRARL